MDTDYNAEQAEQAEQAEHDESHTPPPVGRLVALVGCGFVGSIVTDEFLKRTFAGELGCRFLFIDFDTVEARNAANQNFDLNDAGRYKAEVLGARAGFFGADYEFLVERLTASNAEELLRGAALVIDGVDNLATRQLLWAHAQGTGIPTLHVGVTADGTGKVEWSHPQHDTFSLAPQHTAGKTIVDPPSGVTKPCDLVRMRGVGLNIGLAAAKAAAIYLGFDPEGELEVETDSALGWMTSWVATPTGHAPVKELWAHPERGVRFRDVVPLALPAAPVAPLAEPDDLVVAGVRFVGDPRVPTGQFRLHGDTDHLPQHPQEVAG